KAIGCGDYHALVVSFANSKCYATGLNSYGQLGLGDLNNRDRLTRVVGLKDNTPMAVAAGSHHSVVLCMEGLFSFGRNDSGQLGVTEVLKEEDWGSGISDPTEVTLTDARGRPSMVECGANHNLVVTSEHELYTWGYGDTLALGLGNDKDQGLPKKVDLKKMGVTKVLDADGGGQHSVLICVNDP
ncbi:unnamed protein product, partial [Discosporangium mesarthrocarpum]